MIISIVFNMRQRQVLVMLMAIVYICSSATQKSQTSFRLTGQVLDQLTHVQIPGSKVEIMKLSDSTIIDSTDATTKIVSGNESRLESTFTLKIPRIEGDYILRVSLNGYETYYEQLTFDHFYSRETHRDLGNIYLKKERNVNLDEVTVTASKVKVLLAAEYQRYVDLIGINGQSANSSVVNNSGLTEMLQLNYLLGQSTIGIKSSGTWGNVTSDRDDFTALNVADFNYGLTAQLQLPWQLHLGTDLTMYSRRGYADERMNTNDLVWNARLSRSFLRGQLNVILDGFDILGRLSNINRSMNSQSITEVRTNVIPRYVLLHVTYRFHSAR